MKTDKNIEEALIQKEEEAKVEEGVPQTEGQEEKTQNAEVVVGEVNQELVPVEQQEVAIEIKEEPKRLELEEDYYCLTYVAHIKLNREKHNIKCDETANMFKTCAFLFTVQLLFILLIGQEIFQSTEVVATTYEVYLTRFICTILLHFKLEKEIRVSLSMIKYFANQRTLFDETNHPFYLSVMKLTGAILTEIVNILLICKQTTIMDAVMNFIALEVIAEIDNLYAESLKNLRIKEAI